MTDKNLLRKIGEMADRGELSPEKVNQLLLEATVQVLTKLNSIEARLEHLEDEKKQYPTMREMWAKDPKMAFAYTTFYFLVGLIVFSPLIISDVRQPLLRAIFDVLRGIVP